MFATGNDVVVVDVNEDKRKLALFGVDVSVYYYVGFVELMFVTAESFYQFGSKYR